MTGTVAKNGGAFDPTGTVARNGDAFDPTGTVAMIGGSFNPVTLAHVELGQIARRELGASCRVVYVPAPDRFLAAWKEMAPGEILSGQQRLSLLRKAMEPEGFWCDDCELTGKTSGRTYDTLLWLRERYNAARLVYVCGSDKLPELGRWYRADEMAQLAYFLVVPRAQDDVAGMLRSTPFLQKHRERFQVSKAHRRYPDCSATRVRESLQAGTQDWREMVPDSIREELKGMVSQQCQ